MLSPAVWSWQSKKKTAATTTSTTTKQIRYNIYIGNIALSLEKMSIGWPAAWKWLYNDTFIYIYINKCIQNCTCILDRVVYIIVRMAIYHFENFYFFIRSYAIGVFVCFSLWLCQRIIARLRSHFTFKFWNNKNKMKKKQQRIARAHAHAYRPIQIFSVV